MALVDSFLEIIALVSHVVNGKGGDLLQFEPFSQDIRRLTTIIEAERGTTTACNEDYDDARFAVYAWVDETILCSQLSWREQWLHQPLQRTYFGCSTAGEEFFVRLSKLLEEQHQETDKNTSPFPELLELYDTPPTPKKSGRDLPAVLAVFTLCLELGFSGKFFMEGADDSLSKLKAQCLSIMRKEEGLAENNHEQQLFASAYSDGSKIETTKHSRVFDLSFWSLIALPGLITAIIFFTYWGILNNMLELP